MRNLAARHRSQRAIFDHAWRLLSAREQAMLPQLAVFRCGFRPAEAQAVTGASQVAMDTLVDRSLLAVDGRYDLHERMHQYLLEKLRQELSVYRTANDRHSQIYLSLLKRDPVEFYKQTTLQRLTENFENLRAAWHWATDYAHWSAIRRAQWGVHIFCLCNSWFLEENEVYGRTISHLAQPRVPTEAGTEAETETEIQLLLAVVHCDHGEVQGRLVSHNPARQTMVNENLNILGALGPTACPELADVLASTAVQNLRRLVNDYVTHRSGQQEDALVTVTMVPHHPSTVQETKDRLTELHARFVAALPPAIVEAVRTHEPTIDSHRRPLDATHIDLSRCLCISPLEFEQESPAYCRYSCS